MLDEGLDDDAYVSNNFVPFDYKGTINLHGTKNVGIDLQGTHTGYSQTSSKNPEFTDMSKVANTKVINSGTINGIGNSNINSQVAFGFNNYDTSSNNTRTEMINKGTITLGAINSAGMQLKPENPKGDQL